MSERLRFRRVVERPDWSPPIVAIIEVAYLPHPRRISDANWSVVYLSHPLGPVVNPERIMEVQQRLAEQFDFHDEILDACREDFAHRMDESLTQTLPKIPAKLP